MKLQLDGIFRFSEFRYAKSGKAKIGFLFAKSGATAFGICSVWCLLLSGTDFVKGRACRSLTGLRLSAGKPSHADLYYDQDQ